MHGGKNKMIDIYEEDINHIYPIDDIFPHLLVGIQCLCRPLIKWEGMLMIVIHYSWDNREIMEQFIEEYV